MNISIYGTGYVGLVTGACLAAMGYNVLCVDVDGAKISQLQQGIVPIFEPGLEAMVRKNATEGRLRFTTDAAWAVRHANVQIIAVGTPPQEERFCGFAACSAAAKTIAQLMESRQLIVNKSTVPVGTADRWQR